MADPATINRPLTRSSVRKAHDLIKPYIHHTPVITCETLSDLASTPQDAAVVKKLAELRGDETLLKEINAGNAQNGQEEGQEEEQDNVKWRPARPKIRLFFKCENFQKIGAFKARGAFHALSRLTDGELENGVITHSSGNHAQALALAAKTRGIPAYIIMPTISTPSKIAATKSYGARVHFSGSTSIEREALVAEVQVETGARLVPPYDHPDIILGQGTMALEFEQQVKEMGLEIGKDDAEREGYGWRSREARRRQALEKRRERRRLLRAERNGHGSGGTADNEGPEEDDDDLAEDEHSIALAHSEGLDAVIAPLGGGGMLSGIATALFGTGTYVFGAEPSFEGGDDGRRGLSSNPPQRIEKVSTLTIADGLRTPVGAIPWSIISDKEKVREVYSVGEEEIKRAMRLLMERAKVVVEPSAAVGLAVCLFDERFRGLVEREAGKEGWNVGVVLSGGNTTMEAIGKLFEEQKESKVSAGGKVEVEKGEREQGKMGLDGKRVAENVAG